MNATNTTALAAVADPASNAFILLSAGVRNFVLAALELV
jgi:hypothetical protein